MLAGAATLTLWAECGLTDISEPYIDRAVSTGHPSRVFEHSLIPDLSASMEGCNSVYSYKNVLHERIIFEREYASISLCFILDLQCYTLQALPVSGEHREEDHRQVSSHPFQSL